MRRIGSLLAILCVSWLAAESSLALTVDEIVKLKQAGVADSTIELLIKRGGDARSAGVWKQDGWIIHSTESKFPEAPKTQHYQEGFPLTVYPQIFPGRPAPAKKP
jgi:hypothetical protein